ncbi:unnamed protein product [Parnassius mnemosyne]|uniref:PHD-type domain-containing protein n=1 Tax=Parnassius mnemosyne TaxID=213953 RepID=A0AAV1MCI6_9NEOP
MASVTLKCSGCFQVITNKQYLICSKCNESYDLDCANVSSKRFYNIMSPERKNKWICQTCRSNMPKTIYTNTPIRDLKLNIFTGLTEEQQSPSISNITLRTKRTSNANDSIFRDSDSSVFGDTLRDCSLYMQQTSTTTASIGTDMPAEKLVSPIILQRWEEILDKKLNILKVQIVTELKESILTEIENIASKTVTKETQVILPQNVEDKKINTKNN